MDNDVDDLGESTPSRRLWNSTKLATSHVRDVGEPRVKSTFC